jgi:hypothetical protein
VAVENRLTPEQLTGLDVGDLVTIESAADFRRPRYLTGEVIRLTASHIAVCVTSSRAGVTYEERFGRWDGLRIGAGRRAELVNPQPRETSERQQATRRLDELMLAWRRDRSDLEALRRLHTVIGEYLDDDG